MSISKTSIFNSRYDIVLNSFGEMATYFENRKYKVRFSSLTGELSITNIDINMIFLLSASKESSEAVRIVFEVKTDFEDEEEGDMNPELSKIISGAQNQIKKEYASKYLDILFVSLCNCIDGKANLEFDLREINFEEMSVKLKEAEKFGFRGIFLYIVVILFGMVMLILGLRSAGIL